MINQTIATFQEKDANTVNLVNKENNPEQDQHPVHTFQLKGSRTFIPETKLYQQGIRLVDIKKILNISSSTLTKILKKLNIGTGLQGKGRSITSEQARMVCESRGFLFNNETKFISIAVNKGGAGKTTYTHYISYRLACLGYKVLAVDTDSQGHLGRSFNFDAFTDPITSSTPILRDVLEGKCELKDTIIPYSTTLHVIPSTPENTFLYEVLPRKYKNIEKGIRDMFAPVRNEYDFIIFDTAPAIDIVFDFIVAASDFTLLPIYPDVFSKASIDLTIEEIRKLQDSFNREIKYKIFFTKYDQRENASMQYIGDIARDYANITCKSVMRTSTDYKNAIKLNRDLFGPEFKNSKALEDIDNLISEIINNLSLKLNQSQINLN